MKSILCLLTMLGVVALNLAGQAQTNSPAADVPASATDAAGVAAAATPAPAPATAAAAEPAKEPTAPLLAQNQPATEPAPAGAAPASAPPTNAAPANPAAPTESAAAAAPEPVAAPASQPGSVIPLIVMDDVPLTDAIRNLARQAGINYVLDPRIGFGQLGADGKPLPQPSVSIRWENVTAAQALNALLNNYNLQLAEDPKTKIDRVTVRDPAAPPPLITKIIQLKWASPSNVLVSVQKTFTDKRSTVVPDTRTSQLVVLSTESELDAVDMLIERLDTPTRQVLIEARLLETSINPTSVKGIDWSGTLQAQHISVGNNLQTGPVPQSSANNPLSTLWPKMMLDTSSGFNPATAFLDADGVNAVLSFLNTYAEAKIISTPRTVTLDNEAASIEVGTMYPIVNVTAGTANTTGGSSISYSNLTVRLDVTPRISANNFIHLKVSPKVLRLGSQVTTVVSGVANTVDSFSKREMDTTVLIPSGNTLVMGGLIEDNILRQNTKVPILGDIPGLGLLFRTDSKSRTKSNLLLFLTPTIITDADYQPTSTKFLKTPVPTKDILEPEWSAWDSGKPKDWSKPKNADSDDK